MNLQNFTGRDGVKQFKFGYESNGLYCEKGCHAGIGDISPQDRAARAARMRETMLELMPAEMRAFLVDWEKHHGTVQYRMDVIGTYSGTLEGFKHMKGQPLKGAVFVDTKQLPKTPYRAYAD